MHDGAEFVASLAVQYLVCYTKELCNCRLPDGLDGNHTVVDINKLAVLLIHTEPHILSSFCLLYYLQIMQPQISIPGWFLALTACANAASIARRDVRASSTLQTGWSYSGCYTDNNNGIRQLSRDGYRDYSAMTEESCVAYCSSKGYPVAGVEYSSEVRHTALPLFIVCILTQPF